jgi:hypothetical protein
MVELSAMLAKKFARIVEDIRRRSQQRPKNNVGGMLHDPDSTSRIPAMA